MPAERGARFHGRWGMWIGCALLAHFVFLCWLKSARGVEWEMLWVSHASLGLAAAGLVIGSGLCVSTALVSVAVLHGIWLADAALLGLTGRSLLGLTGYLAEADGLTWLGTSHHFYLLPLLAAVVVRGGAFRRASLPVAIGVFAVLAVLSRVAAPAWASVNGAHGLFPGAGGPVLSWINGLAPATYLVVLVAGVGVLLFAPAWWAMVRLEAGGRCARRGPGLIGWDATVGSGSTRGASGPMVLP